MNRSTTGKLAWIVPISLSPFVGCIAESSFEMAPEDRRPVLMSPSVSSGAVDTRTWLASAQSQLADLLPKSSPAPLLTDDLVGPDGVSDVGAHFRFDPTTAHTILGNANGLRCTAQGACQKQFIDVEPPAWEGFDDVWIPVADDLALSARFGRALSDDGSATPAMADAIVILPGFLGDNGVTRTMDLAKFLRGAGFHVLAVELRGHGQTERRYPQSAYTFGVRECDDLMLVADWLTDKPYVRRTGLVGYCWSANTALLTAWYENRPEADPNIAPGIADLLVTTPSRRRFQAGIIAFSPILRWEALVTTLEDEFGFIEHPVYHSLQETICGRMERKQFHPASGSLRDLIDAEYAFGGVMLSGGSAEGYRFLRILPYADRPCPPKLIHARTPTLIVHGVDDPLAPAQDVADLIAREDNAQVAALILPGGGHVGFAAYCKTYYYSLVAAFLDPDSGAAAGTSSQLVLPSGRSPRILGG